MTQGIDMSKSSWENPDGFTPRERPERAPAPEPVCEAAGPDGWVCDLKPNHRGDVHRADGGPDWPRTGVTPAGDLEPRVSGTWNPMDGVVPESSRAWDDAQRFAEVRAIAVKALESQAPAAWAVALTKIEEMTHGY